ncbi:MAG: CinA family protein [Chloroflexi bacterium]|nr:CinA family protein [Chloroflexota bacterium]
MPPRSTSDYPANLNQDWSPGPPRRTRELVERIAAQLVERRLTVAVAESLTGGLLAAGLTELAGSSTFFLGGVVAYADRAKVDLLGVPAETIQRETAVSEPVAAAMASGARWRLQADLALATTGLAGPGDGGTGLPVGLTFIALATPAGTAVHRFQLPGDRGAVRAAAVQAALAILDEWLEGSPPPDRCSSPIDFR